MQRQLDATGYACAGSFLSAAQRQPSQFLVSLGCIDGSYEGFPKGHRYLKKGTMDFPIPILEGMSSILTRALLVVRSLSLMLGSLAYFSTFLWPLPWYHIANTPPKVYGDPRRYRAQA